MTLIKSSRLTLRPLVLSDARDIKELFNQPDCLQFIGDKQIHSIADAKRYLLTGPIQSYRNNGFGLLAVTYHGQFIGVCGLLSRQGHATPDLGYSF